MHYIGRSNWLRATVLGANDGILSIASILIGMATGQASQHAVLLAGVAGLVAGAASMATGEYVSVCSQADVERADLTREKHELQHNAPRELEELKQIYIERGLTPELAQEVAVQLTAHDDLSAHARDELGISDALSANPLQAALASAASFLTGGALPLLMALIAPADRQLTTIVVSTIVTLLLLGALGAWAGGVRPLRPMGRVLLWGMASMALSALVGQGFAFSL